MVTLAIFGDIMRIRVSNIITLTIIVTVVLIIGIIIGNTTRQQSTNIETITMTITKHSPISVIDELGRIITFDEVPKRVVSLAPSITEILFALGLKDNVIGVTSHCNYPPEVVKLVEEGRIAIIGGFWNPDVEKIIALRPNLVIGSVNTRPHINLKEKLEEIGIKIIYVKGSGATSDNDIFSDIATIAKIFGVENRAKELIKNISNTIDYIENRLAKFNITKPKVLQLLGPPSIGLWSSGGDTFIGWIISIAGGINIAQKFSGWPQLDYEYIIAQNPDVIIINTMGGINIEDVAKDIKNSPLCNTNAFEKGRIYILVDEANDVLLRPGPRIEKAVMLIAQLLYPEIFGESEIQTVYKVENLDITTSTSTIALLESILS